MMTLAQLVLAISQLPREFRNTEVRFVVGVREVERGPSEGAVVITSTGVASLCVGTQGMFLFLDQNKANHREEPMPFVPPNFPTGDKEFDQKRWNLLGGEDGDHGEDWKKG
jgi:hypothetical protein